MDSAAFWGRPGTEGDEIGGDRRQDRRYPLQLEMKWKLIRRRRVLDSGKGQTLDLSSGGILFDAGRHLPEGLNVELAISWPVLLRDVAPMQLVAVGKIIRSNARHAAIQTTQHEFRTVGISSDNRNSQPGSNHTGPVMTSAAVFAAFSKL
jgi:hypothetical protein